MLENIRNTLSELLVLVESMQANNEFHQLDKDTLQGKTRELYSAILLEQVQQKNKTASIYPETNPASQKKNDKDKKQEKTIPIIKTPDINNIHDSLNKASNVSKISDTTIETIKTTIANADKTEGKPISIPDFSQFVSQSISQTPTGSNAINQSPSTHATLLQSKLKPNKVQDISTAIGINDKIFFIKQLFNGDTTKYNTAISGLNKAQSLDDAIQFLNSSTNKDAEDPAISKLVDFIKRKF